MEPQVRVLIAGADAFLLKGCSIEALKNAILTERDANA